MSKLVVGLTGEIGCGKSYIAGLFTTLGVNVTNIDLDAVAHGLLRDNDGVKSQIIDTFGTVDRKELGQMIFRQPHKRHILNHIVYPYLYSETEHLIEKNQGLILVNGALIVEANFFASLCDCQTIVVLTPADKQVENLLTRGYTIENSIQRVASQLSSAQKILSIKRILSSQDFGFVDYIYNYRGDELSQIGILLNKYHAKL